MDARRFSEPEWRTMAATLLRIAIREGDMQKVQVVSDILTRETTAVETLEGLTRQLATEIVEIHMARAEADYRAFCFEHRYPLDDRDVLEEFFSDMMAEGRLTGPTAPFLEMDPCADPHLDYENNGCFCWATTFMNMFQARVCG